MKILVWFYDNELAGEEDERKCIERGRERERNFYYSQVRLNWEGY